MADELTAEQKKRIEEWFTKFAKKRECPVCEMKAWIVADHLVTPAVWSSSGTHIGGQAYPTALIVCSFCTYTHHMMALPILSSLSDKKSMESSDE